MSDHDEYLTAAQRIQALQAKVDSLERILNAKMEAFPKQHVMMVQGPLSPQDVEYLGQVAVQFRMQILTFPEEITYRKLDDVQMQQLGFSRMRVPDDLN